MGSQPEPTPSLLPRRSVAEQLARGPSSNTAKSRRARITSTESEVVDEDELQTTSSQPVSVFRRARIAEAEAEVVERSPSPGCREQLAEGQADVASVRRRRTRRLTAPARSDAAPLISLFPERDGLASSRYHKSNDDVAGLIMRKLDSTRRPVGVVKIKSEATVCGSSLGPTTELSDDAEPWSPQESSSDGELCEADVDLDDFWSAQSVEFLACWAVFAIATVLLAMDLCREGLGVKNRWVPSLADSLSSCASFRNYRPSRKCSQRRIRNRGRAQSLYCVSAPRNSWLQSLAIVVLNWCSKFGSATAGSLLLGETPVILKGPRHMISWFTVFAIIQICPGDLVFNMLRESCALRFILRIGCAVYKLRKFNFVVLCQTFSALYVLLVQAVIIDGNSIAQKTCVSLMTFRLGIELPHRQADRMWLFVSELAPEIRAVLWRIAPLTALTIAARCSLPSENLSFCVRIVTLSFFLHRCDAHGAALECWQERTWIDLAFAMRTTPQAAIAALLRASKRMCLL